MMHTVRSQLEAEIREMEPGRFQDFCLSFLPILDSRLTGIQRHGHTAAGKTRKGTPDLILTRPNGNEIAVQCSTAADYWRLPRDTEKWKPIRDARACIKNMNKLVELILISNRPLPTSPSSTKSRLIDVLKRETAIAFRAISVDEISQLMTANLSDPAVEALLRAFFPRIAETVDLLLALGLRGERGEGLTLLPPDGSGLALESVASFESITAAATRGDEFVLRATRDGLFLSPEETREKYERLLRSYIPGTTLHATRFVRLMEISMIRDSIAATVPSPDLRIEVGRGFEQVTFKWEGKALRLEWPNLLWDCTCQSRRYLSRGTTDEYERRSCPIHDGILNPSEAEHLEDLFQGRLVEFSYEDNRFLWQCSDVLFPPSRDAFHMVDALESAGAFADCHESILDLGSGTGLLGILAARRCRKARQVAFTDWLITPLVFSAINLNRCLGRRSATMHVELVLALSTSWTGRHHAPKSYDLVLCNPPYLPVLDQFRELSVATAVAGTDLLEAVIRDCATLGREVYVSFSHLAMPEARRAEQAAGCKLVPICDPARVPFRNPYAFRSDAYVAWLRRKRDLEYSSGEHHPLWHRVGTYRIEPRH